MSNLSPTKYKAFDEKQEPEYSKILLSVDSSNLDTELNRESNTEYDFKSPPNNKVQDNGTEEQPTINKHFRRQSKMNSNKIRIQSPVSPIYATVDTFKRQNTIERKQDKREEMKVAKAKSPDYEESKYDQIPAPVPAQDRLKAVEELDPNPVKDQSPMIGKDKQRTIKVMDQMFNTSGVFGKRKGKCTKKKSRFWGPDELLQLMGSVSKLN